MTLRRFKNLWLALLCLSMILIIMRLAGAVVCSWWWVIAPVWMPVALIVCGIIFMVLLHNRPKKQR